MVSSLLSNLISGLVKAGGDYALTGYTKQRLVANADEKVLYSARVQARRSGNWTYKQGAIIITETRFYFDQGPNLTGSIRFETTHEAANYNFKRVGLGGIGKALVVNTHDGSYEVLGSGKTFDVFQALVYG